MKKVLMMLQNHQHLKKHEFFYKRFSLPGYHYGLGTQKQMLENQTNPILSEVFDFSKLFLGC